MKRLVCSMDGTWNDDEGEASPQSNAAKLASAVLPADHRGTWQLVRFVFGKAPSEEERLPSLRSAAGFEISERIKAGYEFLRNTYEPGDEIYLFGVSRGAYEARSLASFIALFGIARKDADFPIDEAWRLYRKSERRRKFDTVAELSAACHYPVRIRCIGAWDTVGHAGNPNWPWAWLARWFNRHDLRWHNTIDIALHAVSIDETRGAFRPSMFTLPDDVVLPSHQRVEQAWFPGTHADVGGGSPETELSDLALHWMIEKIQSMTELAIDIERLERESRPDPLGVQHVSDTGWSSVFSRRVPYLRLVREDVAGIPNGRRRAFGNWRTSKLGKGLISLNETIHQSALERLGQTIREAKGSRVHERIYEPSTLVAAVSPTREEAPSDEEVHTENA
ncbi:DUF2235 domain-containing protein [Hyphomicrobium sp.]|uniref:DUF2235 domain-containing protein n=1 Tax=Hyphomicrobium sp. TaxID=82 RepID=UPI001DB7487D|nr:DUF2235 domain-containing protein [Hyphomicrobium sp.]MBY0559011.1 DUF2235 domain-containing protein [Hyphomicrobium sp.]